MKAEGHPYARKHETWPEALSLIERSGLRGHIVVMRDRPGVYHAVVSSAVPMQSQSGEGETPLAAVELAIGRARAAAA